MIKQLVTVAFSVFILASCASTQKDDFATAWDAAEAKREEAASLGYEWRDTGEMLAKALEEHAAGNKDTAMKLVAQALEESNDAIAQYHRETEAWAKRVPQ